MACTRNSTLIKEELIRYISSLDLEVNTATKARGNRGFFKAGRIDVSKTLDDNHSVRVLLHEFAHYSNYILDKSFKSLEVLFGHDNKVLRDELIEVTRFVDKNSLCAKLIDEKELLKQRIKELYDNIKKEYPNFTLTNNFKEFKKYSKSSDLKYLEKYDRVKVKNIASSKIYSVSNVKKDFPDLPDVFADYLTLKSCQRKRAKISRRINKLTSYYNEPCELFARFVESLYIDIDYTKKLAPNAFANFQKFYNKGYYKGLLEVFSIVRIIL